MKAFKLDRDGAMEVEVPADFVVASGFDWDCVRLENGHGAWVRDDALFQRDVALATVGGRRNVPLPAYVLGIDGERKVDATMSLEDLRGQVELQGRYL